MSHTIAASSKRKNTHEEEERRWKRFEEKLKDDAWVDRQLDRAIKAMRNKK